MGEWKEYKLGDIADITSSKRIFYSEYVSEGIPFYRSKEIIDLYNKRNISTELYISESKYCEIQSMYGVPQENDILLTSVGSLGFPYLVKATDKFYFKDGNLAWIRNINRNIVFPPYLIIWLCSKIGRQKLDEITIGSTQQALTISGLKTIEIALPPLSEQKRIASILGSLDDKIDLLHRENETLEAMAETLFRKWFIEDAKDEWDDNVGTYAEHYKVSINPPKYNNTIFKHYSIPAFDNGKNPILENSKDIKSNKYIVQNNCILFSKLNPHKDKRVWLIIGEDNKNAICSTEFQIIKPLKKEYLYFLYGWLTNKENYEEISLGVGGTSSSHQRIDPQSIFSFSCPNLNINKVNDYNAIVRPLFQKQKLNQNQIVNLKEQRDKLLRKLISN